LARSLNQSCSFVVFPDKSKKVKKEKSGEPQAEADFQIKPENINVTLDTSEWPLLLKVQTILFS